MGKYNQCINDMMEGDLIKKKPMEELKSNQGPIIFILHMAAYNPNSQSISDIIVFNIDGIKGRTKS